MEEALMTKASDMKFPAFYMTEFRGKWAAQAPTALHSSNPQPFTVGELNDLIQDDVFALQPDTSLDYGSDVGYLPLRQALCDQLYPSLTADQLLTCTGAQEGIHISMHALLEKGDKVVALTPLFEPLIATARQIGCDIELLPLDSENAWQLNLQKLVDTLNRKTKMLIINYPHNPTGAMISDAQLALIVRLCQQHDIWLFSDEVFRGLEHDPANRLPAVADKYPKGISLGVMSKAFAAPALRVGWLACQNAVFLEKCKTIKSYLSICNDQLGERAAAKVIPHAEAIFTYHRDRLVDNLKLLEQYKGQNSAIIDFHPARAGCTVFASFSGDNEEFTSKLVENAGLLVIPGKAFCTTYNAVRLGFGMAGFEGLIDRLKLKV
jgi:aspartate/methionine/tyrosine aminotransferase